MCVIYEILFSSVTQSCLTLCDPMDCSTLGFPVHHQLLELLKLMSIESVMPSNHVILCRPLFLLPFTSYYVHHFVTYFHVLTYLCVSYEHTERLLFLKTTFGGCLHHRSFSLCPFNGFLGSFWVLPIGSGCRDCPRIPSCVSEQQNKQVGWRIEVFINW